MSFDKAIKSGKEQRKPFRGSKAVDATCRNHGSCPDCECSRKHRRKKQEPLFEAKDLEQFNQQAWWEAFVKSEQEQFDRDCLDAMHQIDQA